MHLLAKIVLYLSKCTEKRLKWDLRFNDTDYEDVCLLEYNNVQFEKQVFDWHKQQVTVQCCHLPVILHGIISQTVIFAYFLALRWLEELYKSRWKCKYDFHYYTDITKNMHVLQTRISWVRWSTVLVWDIQGITVK